MAGQKIPAALAQEIVRLRVAEGLRYPEIQEATGAALSVISRACTAAGCGANFEAVPNNPRREGEKLAALKQAAALGTAEAWGRARLECGEGATRRLKRAPATPLTQSAGCAMIGP